MKIIYAGLDMLFWPLDKAIDIVKQTTINKGLESFLDEDNIDIRFEIEDEGSANLHAPHGGFHHYTFFESGDKKHTIFDLYEAQAGHYIAKRLKQINYAGTINKQDPKEFIEKYLS